MPTPFMCHECDSPTMNKDGVCDNCIEPTTADEYNIDLNDRKREERIESERKYNLNEIREAVDIVIGDDGFRSKEVIEILKQGV